MTPNTTDLHYQLSDLDQRILELNKQQLSCGKISIKLMEQGIKLSRESVFKHLREMSQDPSNGVLHLRKIANSEEKRKNSRWYKILTRLPVAMQEYQKEFGFKPGVRTMAYQLDDEKLLNIGKDFNTFDKYTVEARLGYIDPDGKLLWPKLPIDCFPDDTRIVLGSRNDSHAYGPGPATEPDDPEDYINEKIDELIDSMSYYNGQGRSGYEGYRGGRWFRQPEYVEVWIEKNDLADAVNTLLKDVGVKIRANKGYSSLDFLHQCTNELIEIRERFAPEHIHIKYCGDWDPSGWRMIDYMRRRLKQLGMPALDFKRVAVLPEQLDGYKLPWTNITPKKNGDKDNPNLSEFIRLFGPRTTHINAFFTKKHIRPFQKLLIGEINNHWDESIYDENIEEFEEQDTPEPENWYDEDEAREMMVNIITERFEPGWYQRYNSD